MNKLKLFFIFFTSITFIGCLSQSINESKSNSIKDFKQLQIDFKKNLKNQLNRICFPIQNEILDLDGEIEKKKMLNKKDWLFIDLFDKKYSQKWFYTKQECKLIVEIVDTGIHVEYIFRWNKKRWMLYKIVDQSS